jgi:hypothetical protein
MVVPSPGEWYYMQLQEQQRQEHQRNVGAGGVTDQQHSQDEIRRCDEYTALVLRAAWLQQ